VFVYDVLLDHLIGHMIVVS